MVQVGSAWLTCVMAGHTLGCGTAQYSDCEGVLNCRPQRESSVCRHLKSSSVGQGPLASAAHVKTLMVPSVLLVMEVDGKICEMLA